MTTDSPGIMQAVGDTIARATDLLLLELRVARAEIGERARVVRAGATLIVVGAVLLTAALYLLLQAVVIGLVQAGILTPFGATLLVGIVVVAIGAAFVVNGKKQLEATSLVPQRALTDLQRDGAIVKEKLS